MSDIIDAGEMRHPSGFSLKDMLNTGCFGMVYLEKGSQTVIKSPHSEEYNKHVAIERRIYERIEACGGHSSLLRFHGTYDETAIRLEYARRLRWAIQVTDALSFLHRAGVIHGDLTCNNIFLDANLDAKLGDFAGSSLDGSPLLVVVTESHAYLGDKLSVRGDLFALGSVLYEIVRTAFQLGSVAFVTLILVFFLDNRYRVLPSSIHNHLPVHHGGLVITDIHLTKCSALSLLSSCSLDSSKWQRIEKDLYLNRGWLSSRAYLHVQRKKEEDLLPEDSVIVDIMISRLDPATSEKGQGESQWESRPSGIWIRRTAQRHASDSLKTVTAVDVLFGADAVEPRTGWQILDPPLLLDSSGEVQEARMSIRRGPPKTIERPVPRIRKDGRFKIMQVSDLHLSTGLGVCRDAEPPKGEGIRCDADPRTLEFVGSLLDQEKPDLVILSGDQVNGETAPDAQSAVFKFAELFITRKIPYATIFGNHDDEGSLSRSSLMSLTESLPYSLSEAGPSSADGVGNYIVEVRARGSSQHSALTLYLLDTHGYSPNEKRFKGYDWLKDNQISWFRETAQGLKKAHREYTHVHMDLAFIHIPLPEYRKPENIRVGTWKEPPTAPAFNSGFRDALVDEGVLLVSCGHDHVNDYCSLEKTPAGKPALWMCYAGGSGFGGYGGWGGYDRRVRFFEIDTNEARITTYKRLEAGDTERRIDEQIVVEGGNVMAPP
ncbi:MAG: hypothetical protein M1825_000096 [Sarcosagium campestre]|nr:MAG: hypothetical protein M1825_000096 [Sarcosagium campestre]